MEHYEETMNEGEMTYVEYIKQHDQSFRDEYREYCIGKGLNPETEEAAMAFIDFCDEEFDVNMDN